MYEDINYKTYIFLPLNGNIIIVIWTFRRLYTLSTYVPNTFVFKS